MNKNLISLVGMIIVLGFAIGFDLFMNAYENYVQQSFETQMFNLHWEFRMISVLVFALIFMALAWWVIYKIDVDRYVSFIYLATGLLVWIISTPWFNFTWAYLPHDRFPRSIIRSIAIYPDQMIGFAGAFIAAIGLFSLFSRDNNRAMK